PWGAWILTHRYDNITSIDEILASERDVEITIFHGEDDRLIPAEMGRALADQDEEGATIEFIPVAEAGHNDIIYRILPRLVEKIGDPVGNGASGNSSLPGAP
ncbi:MAG: hypothetical protein AAF491_08905, partial [Verrucomicrobiota bacterium]